MIKERMADEESGSPDIGETTPTSEPTPQPPTETERTKIERTKPRGPLTYKEWFKEGIKRGMSEEEADEYASSRDFRGARRHMPIVIGGRELREDEIRSVLIKAYGGFEREVRIPKDDNLMQQWMREVLYGSETSIDEGGGGIYEQAKNELAQIIFSLRRSNTEEDKRLAEGLYAEFQARTSLNTLFKRFETADSLETVTGLLKSVRIEYLAPIFSLKEVQEAFKLYENDEIAEEFIKARGLGVNEVRRKIQEKLAEKLGIEKTEDVAWAQLWAERIWMITGRMAAHDGLETKDPFGKIEDLHFEDTEHHPGERGREESRKGEIQFKGPSEGGGFFLRRTVKYKDWLVYYTKKIFPYRELLEEIDIDEGDFFSKTLISGLMKHFEMKLFEEYMRDGVDDGSGSIVRGNTELSRRAAIKKAVEETSRIVGIIPKPELDKNKKQEEEFGRPKWEWGEEGKPLDLSNVKWEEVDFSMFGKQPFLAWSIYNLDYPEKARVAMTEKSESFLRNPTAESLLGLKDVFGYLDEGQWKLKEKLLENFLRFARHQKDTITGKRKYTYDKLIAIINKAVAIGDEQGTPFIQPRKREEIVKKVLESENMFTIITNNLAVRYIWFFLFGFITGLIKEVWNKVINKK